LTASVAVPASSVQENRQERSIVMTRVPLLRWRRCVGDVNGQHCVRVALSALI
jgi:hypothetical protein